MTTSVISFDVSPSDPTCPLAVEVWIDQQPVFSTEHLAAGVPVQFELADDEGEHELQIVLKNKLAEHTSIDSEGNITKDAVINASNFLFDKISVDHIVQEQAVYHHDFNGSAAPIQDQFYGIMGCNGTLSLKFSTPIYLWMLEHM